MDKTAMKKLYIVVRADLSPGLQIAQSCHAMREFAELHPEIDKDWYKNSNYIVCLSVPNEMELGNFVRKLINEYPCPFAVFWEPDLENSLTAVAIWPNDATKKLLQPLPLALSNK